MPGKPKHRLGVGTGVTLESKGPTIPGSRDRRAIEVFKAKICHCRPAQDGLRNSSGKKHNRRILSEERGIGKRLFVFYQGLIILVAKVTGT